MPNGAKVAFQQRRWLMKFFRIGCLTALVPFAHGCSWTYSDPARIEGISRVLMHEPGAYTLLIDEPDGRISRRTYIGMCDPYATVQLFHDAPADKSMWAVHRTVDRGFWTGGTCAQLLEIHLHSSADINGAGWNHDKFGSGQTTVLE
jgi:hypothetical protein